MKKHVRRGGFLYGAIDPLHGLRSRDVLRAATSGPSNASNAEQRMPNLDGDETNLERQVAILKDQLAHAQRLTALGELVSTTTHEFNNVLMTIINYAKLGLRHKDAETRQKAFEKILTAGQRAARITNGILGFARNRSGAFEPTDMLKLIDDTLLLLERELNKYRIAVERQVTAVPLVAAIPNQIQQVLLNLLINARQAMPQGGRVIVRLSHDVENNLVELHVRDNGRGMSQETTRRIFDPFFTTKNGPDASGKGGTGLGLSACRDIIEAHRGRIRVQSTLGKGTAFTVMLPLAVAVPDNTPQTELVSG
ncbi:MAG TPA: ATP-binding protein [Pirellulales bacterium]|jgi:signal transduction histidine kinase|nr:ATP-binding protein [Pirellulales bacterium]